MKKTTIFAMLLVLAGSSLLCSKPADVKPQKVYRIVYEVKSDGWYATQAKLWKKEIEKNPQNAKAWQNYYNAVRYGRFEETINTKSKQEKLQQIIDDMEKGIPGTYEYYFLRQWNSGDIADISYAKKAYNLDPDRPDVYYNFISHYMINGDKENAAKFYKKLYQSGDIVPWLLDYNYNTLMSAAENAILLTNGDNDTYPAEMLQFAKDIRRDVTVLNISMSPVESYLQSKLKPKGIEIDIKALKQSSKKGNSNGFSKSVFIRELCREISEKYPDYPIYFALTVYENHYAPLKKDLYNVGLAFQYSTNRIDNIALLKKNIGEKFRLDYINNEWYLEDAPSMTFMPRMNLNYLSGVMMLAEHYKMSGEIDDARNLKELALVIARQSGNEKVIAKIEEKDI
ncbi:hypothetical protein GF337_00940 [candidate division KSB1 bacterium]|nr:hypothetical protein [candidate division KSB1 bacterium]